MALIDGGDGGRGGRGLGKGQASLGEFGSDASGCEIAVNG